VPVEAAARPAGDPQATSADCSAAHRLLGWRPVTSLNRGLAEQWAWHRRRRATGVEPQRDDPRLVPVAL